MVSYKQEIIDRFATAIGNLTDICTELSACDIEIKETLELQDLQIKILTYRIEALEKKWENPESKM